MRLTLSPLATPLSLSLHLCALLIAKQCAERWSDEQDKTETALAGLTKVEEHTISRLEYLAQLLKDRQDSILVNMRLEREVSNKMCLDTR